MLKLAQKRSTEQSTKQFITPAGQVDFPDDAQKQEALNQQWTVNLTGFTDQGITGNPWNLTESADNNWYFNPLTTDTSEYGYQAIQWNAFPGRLSFYYGGGSGSNVDGLVLGDKDLLCLADTGKTLDGRSFAQLPKITDPCPCLDTVAEPRAYGPYGPRGWQDEYCEWSVERDDHGNIVRIDFTCENPEYWNSLWMVDPQRVLELYRDTLDKPQIQLEDLYLRDPTTGQPVIDPSTGRAAYNPLNKWNSGPVSTSTQGGAMHLTSTPNTLQTEISLASSASAPRDGGNTDQLGLLCCAQYGQPGRNSDPKIGQSINQIVSPLDPSKPGSMVTLANPPGLYIQLPNFSRFKTPDGTPASEFWTVKRGAPSFTDAKGIPLPGNYILHATFQVPASKGYTVSDITIGDDNIRWAGQVAKTFLMQISGMAMVPPREMSPPRVRNCVKDKKTPFPQPLQLFHADVFNALINTQVDNLMGEAMNLASNSTLIAPMVKQGQSKAINLASNSTLIAPMVKQGQTKIPMVLTAATLSYLSDRQAPTVSFGPGVTVEVTSVLCADHTNADVYAVPGNTYPAKVSTINLLVSVASTAEVGLRGVLLTNASEKQSIPFPAALNIVAA
jgi:hypothetical protein